MILSKKEKTKQELKEFGHIMALVFTVLAAIAIYRQRPIGSLFITLSVFFTFTSVLFPGVLRPIEKLWMAFGEKMSVVMTFVILTLAYFLAITPLGIIIRLLGKDLLSIKLDKEAKTYWIKVDPEGPQTRPYLPY
jgi:hypothetical protein